jgi:hypothetical protein
MSATESAKPAEQPTSDQLRIREVELAKRRVDRAEADFTMKREVAKEAKAAYERSLQELRHAGDPLPLLDGTQPSDEWRDHPVTELVGLSEGILTKLSEAGISKIGDLTDALSAEEKIAGIGAGKAEKIADALEAFWKEHPEFGSVGATVNAEEAPQSEGDNDGLGLGGGLVENEEADVLGESESDL